MNIFSKLQFKALAASVAVVMAIASPAQAGCHETCESIARSYAEQARSGIQGNAANKCSTSPDQASCIAAEYAYAEYMYTYVYTNAYGSCRNGCR